MPLPARQCSRCQVSPAPKRCPTEEGRLIYRTDGTPEMEALAATFPAGMEIVYSCYRLFSPDVAERVRELQSEWDADARARRATVGQNRT